MNEKRVLGDSWKGWDGEASGPVPSIINEGTGTAKLYILLCAVLFMAAVSGSLYLVLPRIREWGWPAEAAVWGFYGAAFVFCCASMLFFLCRVKVPVIGFFWKKIFIKMWPHVARCAPLLGSSLDRVRNSFIHLFNSIEIASLKERLLPQQVLVLVPRCIHKNLFAKVEEETNRAGVKLFVATGGEAARKVLMKERPKAVIAVACERDLLAGIHDCPSSIVVLGIPNMRPKGPCFETVIKLNTLRGLLKIVL